MSSGPDEATGWFEELYAAADRGEAEVPWDKDAPQQVLLDWTRERGITGAGKRAVVVGSGLGRDAELIASLGFDTVAFDISPTAVRGAQRRHPESKVRYVVADLLELPVGWPGAFDLVVESITVQSLPRSFRERATAAVASLVAPVGTLIVVSGVLGEHEDPDAGPPWPLTRPEIEAFSDYELTPVRIERIDDRWRAEFQKTAG
jgi:SAM-dependent methyltransferase